MTLKKTIISNDPNYSLNYKEDKKAAQQQEDARTRIIVELDRVSQFKEIKLSVSDPNSSISEHVQAKTYPGKVEDRTTSKMVQGLQAKRKEPMSKSLSQADNIEVSRAHTH